MSTASSYDRLNSLLFFPTGSLEVRQRFVQSMSIGRGDRVLEVGCGTGQVTQALLEAGADVVAVEQLPAMLLRARRRAPEATFVATDFRTFAAGSDFDLTVLAFVLHNFDCQGRAEILERAHAATGGRGTVAVLDWASPTAPIARAAWQAIVRKIEPSAAAAEVLNGALARDIAAAGMSVALRHPVAHGRAEVWLAR